MIDKALEAKRESKTIDFKRSFDPGNAGEWCELVKDIVAMSNSGGGQIVVGVEDDGEPGPDGAASAALALDGAQITDKVAKYTGVQFDGFAIAEGVRNDVAVAVIEVSPSAHPLIFERPGTYPVSDGKQKSAFGVGTIYVRHGAKSEPATSSDVAKMVDRLVQSLKRDWMTGVRRIVNAPAGSTVSVLPPGVQQSGDPAATPIRITTDPAAPGYQLVDPDTTHPWRQKELIAEVNKSVRAEDRINQFDIQALRHVYDVDADLRYFHKSRFAAPQYSREFGDWLLERYRDDPNFFRTTREAFKGRRAAS